MSRKSLGQLGLADHLVNPSARPAAWLQRINDLLDWPALAHLTRNLHAARHGAPAWPPLIMLRVVLLSQWYGLSDPACEEALADRVSFRRFCGLSLHDPVPDHSTIHRFRDLLRREGLDQAVLEEVNRQLDARGLILRQGTLIDASLIASAARPPKQPKDEQPPGPDGKPPSKLVKSPHDPDAAWTRKGGRYHFGFKLHVGVDQGSGLIRRFRFSDAAENDTVEADQLICGDEKAVYADAAYHTHRREK